MKTAKFRILRQLTLLQLFSVLVGILGLSGAYYLINRDTYRGALKTERAKVLLSLAEQQEKWRTWKQVGLDDALRADLASHTRVFSLAKLEVLPASGVSFPLSSEEVVIPKPTGQGDGWVVYARLDPSQIEAAYVPYRSNLFLLALCGGLFTLVILFSNRFIRRRVLSPFFELRDALQSLGAGSRVETNQIRASGEIREIITSIAELYRRLQENEKNIAMVAVAKQVAHDIRSPLAALDMILDTLPQLPEQKRMVIRGALGRIRDIANNVLERGRRGVEASVQSTNLSAALATEPLSPQSIASLVEDIVTEKQVLVHSRPEVHIESQMDDSAYGLFACVEPQTFKTVLSNLVNNALEAIPEIGCVRLSVLSKGETLWVNVSDNGGGIPPEIVKRLMESGGSFGKAEGSGLGLTHARAAVERWGGKLEIDSRLGVGTSLKIALPSVPPPAWFVPSIKVAEGTTVVIIDDDASIHLVWEQRFNDAMKAAGAGVFLEHFSDTDSLRRWCSDNNRLMNRILFLCDYEIVGGRETGIELIESLNIADRSILVTGRFDEAGIRARCEALGLRLLPKGLGGCVPVSVQRYVAPVDAVLLDDDPLVHMTWEMAAKMSEKNFRGFFSADEFLACISGMDPKTPVYIDRHLGAGDRGEEIAQKLVRAGFTQVYLATGDTKDDLPEMPWLTGVCDKAPPWRPSRT